MMQIWDRITPHFDISERSDAFGERNGSDYRAHLQAYRGFVRGAVIFAALVLVTLTLLAYCLI